MLPGERDVAGVRCSQVLDRLSALLDGDLTDAEAARMRAHVADCDVCARFGADFGAVVAALRAGGDEPVPAEVAARLSSFLSSRLP